MLLRPLDWAKRIRAPASSGQGEVCSPFPPYNGKIVPGKFGHAA